MNDDDIQLLEQTDAIPHLARCNYPVSSQYLLSLLDSSTASYTVSNNTHIYIFILVYIWTWTISSSLCLCVSRLSRCPCSNCSSVALTPPAPRCFSHKVCHVSPLPFGTHSHTRLCTHTCTHTVLAAIMSGGAKCGGRVSIYLSPVCLSISQPLTNIYTYLSIYLLSSIQIQLACPGCYM